VTDSPHELTLSKLSNTRDLRAGMLSLAAKLLIQADAEGRLVVVNPVISPATVRKEWEESLPAIASNVRERMTLTIEERSASAGHATKPRESDVVALDKPNYLFEVLRLLLGAGLEHATVLCRRQASRHTLTAPRSGWSTRSVFRPHPSAPHWKHCETPT
jgi:hypothetical protein